MPVISRGSAAAEPVTSAEVKEWVRVDAGDTSQDDVITDLITAARQAVEEYAHRALTDTTITWLVDAEDLREPIWLPIADASAVTSITTYDGKAGDSDTVVNSANYELVGNKIIKHADGFSASQTYNAAKIIYVAGYGATAADVPLDIKTAVLKWIAAHVEHRGDEIRKTLIPMPLDVQEILHDGGHLWNWYS